MEKLYGGGVSGFPNIIGTNIIGTNIIGTNIIGTNIIGTNILGTNIIGTNILDILVNRQHRSQLGGIDRIVAEISFNKGRGARVEERRHNFFIGTRTFNID